MRVPRTLAVLVGLCAITGCDRRVSAAPPQTSVALLGAMEDALRSGDAAGYEALFASHWTNPPSPCPGIAEPTAEDVAAAFHECRALAEWSTLEREAINEDDRVCEPTSGCPGFEGLCRAELFLRSPGPNPVHLKLDVSAVRDRQDGRVGLIELPRCVLK